METGLTMSDDHDSGSVGSELHLPDALGNAKHCSEHWGQGGRKDRLGGAANSPECLG